MRELFQQRSVLSQVAIFVLPTWLTQLSRRFDVRVSKGVSGLFFIFFYASNTDQVDAISVSASVWKVVS